MTLVSIDHHILIRKAAERNGITTHLIVFIVIYILCVFFTYFVVGWLPHNSNQPTHVMLFPATMNQHSRPNSKFKLPMENVLLPFPICQRPELKSTLQNREHTIREQLKFINFFDDHFSSDDTAITIFEETPLTSSYLIAFIVSDFQFTSNKNNPSALPHRVYTHRAEIGNTALALKDGERVLGAIENYLKVKFTLPKMDQVAVPDFAAGGITPQTMLLI